MLPVRIEFVNHSGFIVDTGSVRLQCDPWLEGVAFNNGWDLLSKTVHDYDDFRDTTHIWFSHEHPDHFYPPNLKRIAEEHRRKITVLFQKTKDGTVVDFCRKLGFGEVIELENGEWIELAPDVRFVCVPHSADWGECDSWMCLKAKDQTLLNINDCEIHSREDAEQVKQIVGDVDFLTTQFSYAAWQGNVENREAFRGFADAKLEYVRLQSEVFDPTWVMPFASYVWFCHEENFYLNEDVNKIWTAMDFLKERTKARPIVLYPGESWIVGADHDSASSCERYREDYDSLSARPRRKRTPVSSEELIESSNRFVEYLKNNANWWLIRAHMGREGYYRRCEKDDKWNRWAWLASILLCREEPARIFINDHESSYTFDLRHGLRRSAALRSECHIDLSADSLLFCFKFPWGGETLLINGRFQEIYPRSRFALLEYLQLRRFLYHGNKINLTSLALSLPNKFRGFFARD